VCCVTKFRSTVLYILFYSHGQQRLERNHRCFLFVSVFGCHCCAFYGFIALDQNVICPSREREEHDPDRVASTSQEV